VLQSPDQTQRRPGTYYDYTQLRLHLTFSSAFSGTLHLYAVDWDTTARRQTVVVNDGSGPQTVAITTDFAEAVLEERKDATLIPERLRATASAADQILASHAERGMRIISREATRLSLPSRHMVDETHEWVRRIHARAYDWQPPPAVYNAEKAKDLLKQAGFPDGFDAGPFTVDSSYANMGEAAVNYLQQVGIRCKLVPMERAGFASAYANKKLTKGLFRAASGAFGNTATRLASFVVKGGSNVYGSYPDIDELYPQQADEMDQAKRGAILTKMQQLVHEKSIYAPIWQLGFINAVGPRVGESSFDRIAGFAYTAPFEDLTIKT